MRAKVFHAFSTFQLGGPQSRTIELIHALADEPIDHVITAMDGNFSAFNRLAGLPNVKALPLQFRKSSGIGNLSIIRSAVIAEQPTAVIGYNWGAIEWSIANLPKSVMRYHVEEGFSPEEVDKRNWKRNLLRTVLFRVKPINMITVSNTLFSIAKDEWYVPSNKLQLIENGVDLNRFKLNHSKQRQQEAFVLGTVCGLRIEKRIDRLLEAAALIKDLDVKVRIAGDGSQLLRLIELANQLNISDRVEFCGRVEDTPSFYSTLDCFVLTSDTEQAPISMLEAMACGLPCVVTDVGDAKHMLPDSQKDLAVERNPQAIANAIKQVALNRTASYMVFRANVERRFSFLTSLSEWKKIYIHRAQISQEKKG